MDASMSSPVRSLSQASYKHFTANEQQLKSPSRASSTRCYIRVSWRTESCKGSHFPVMGRAGLRTASRSGASPAWRCTGRKALPEAIKWPNENRSTMTMLPTNHKGCCCCCSLLQDTWLQCVKICHCDSFKKKLNSQELGQSHQPDREETRARWKRDNAT